MTRKLNNQALYKHFKGHIYRIITTAKDSEDLSLKVVYQNVENGDTWIRDYEEFLSEVDHTKYPDIKQKYRFEEIRKRWINNYSPFFIIFYIFGWIAFTLLFTVLSPLLLS